MTMDVASNTLLFNMFLCERAEACVHNFAKIYSNKED